MKFSKLNFFIKKTPKGVFTSIIHFTFYIINYKRCDIMIIKLEAELTKLNDIKKFIEEMRASL